MLLGFVTGSSSRPKPSKDDLCVLLVDDGQPLFAGSCGTLCPRHCTLVQRCDTTACTRIAGRPHARHYPLAASHRAGQLVSLQTFFTFAALGGSGDGDSAVVRGETPRGMMRPQVGRLSDVSISQCGSQSRKPCRRIVLVSHLHCFVFKHPPARQHERRVEASCRLQAW